MNEKRHGVGHWINCGLWTLSFLSSTALADYASIDPLGASVAHRVANDLQRHLDSQCQLQLTKHEIMANAPAFGQLAAILLFIDDEQLYARQLAKVSCPILSFADAVQAPALKEPTS